MEEKNILGPLSDCSPFPQVDNDKNVPNLEYFMWFRPYYVKAQNPDFYYNYLRSHGAHPYFQMLMMKELKEDMNMMNPMNQNMMNQMNQNMMNQMN